KILRINSSGDDYDNNYVFSLDQALGVQDSYIETWKYAGDGIGFVVYSIVNNAGERTGGHIARIDLNAKTATKYDIPTESALSVAQLQKVGTEGDGVCIAVAGRGPEGNIYVLDSKTGETKNGARLLKKPGNQHRGVY